jgi:hypothetical protein
MGKGKRFFFPFENVKKLKKKKTQGKLLNKSVILEKLINTQDSSLE